MSHIKSLSRIAVAVVVWLAACTVTQQGGEKVVNLMEKDAGSTVQLNKGDTLNIVLTANPTTGYNWEQVSGDAAILKSTADPEFKADSSALGAGGKMTFHYQAAGAGQTGLKLIYHRTFEKGVAPLQTFEVTVAVK